MDFLSSHQLASIVITIALTLLGKLFYDKYMSQSSRIGRNEFDQALKALRTECELKRGGCVAERKTNKTYFEGLIKQQAGCLEDAFEEEEVVATRRLQNRRALLCIMMTQLKICEALNKILDPPARMDCGDISKMMVELGAIE